MLHQLSTSQSELVMAEIQSYMCRAIYIYICICATCMASDSTMSPAERINNQMSCTEIESKITPRHSHKVSISRFCDTRELKHRRTCTVFTEVHSPKLILHHTPLVKSSRGRNHVRYITGGLLRFTCTSIMCVGSLHFLAHNMLAKRATFLDMSCPKGA